MKCDRCVELEKGEETAYEDVELLRQEIARLVPERDVLRQDLAEAVALLQGLADQVERSGAVDDHGHELKHLKVLADSDAFLAKHAEASDE